MQSILIYVKYLNEDYLDLGFVSSSKGYASVKTGWVRLEDFEERRPWVYSEGGGLVSGEDVPLDLIEIQDVQKNAPKELIEFISGRYQVSTLDGLTQNYRKQQLKAIDQMLGSLDCDGKLMLKLVLSDKVLRNYAATKLYS
jgi:hypothetical protein